MADGCCDRHRLTWDDDGCGPLTRELLAAVDDTARALHSDAINTNNPKHVEITRTMIGLCELLAERMPIALPGRRPSETQSARLGATSVDVSVSRVGGRIVELFVDVAHREGAPMVGIGHAIARLGSLALQHGTPVEAVIRALAGTTGGAAEVTEAEGIARAESIPDLVAQLLELEARR